MTIMLEAVSRVANTLGWRVTINDYPRQLRFGELFVARVSGEAIDYVTPTAQLGGQLVMAMMVRRKLAMAIGLATVVVASLAEAGVERAAQKLGEEAVEAAIAATAQDGRLVSEAADVLFHLYVLLAVAGVELRRGGLPGQSR